MMAWLAFLVADTSSERSPVEAGDSVFRASIDLVRSILVEGSFQRNEYEQPSTSSLDEIPASLLIQSNRLSASPLKLPVSLPELEVLGELPIGSSCEVALMVLLERLHHARLEYVLFAHQHRSTSPLSAEEERACEKHQTVLSATLQGLSDFPLSVPLLHVYVNYQSNVPGGYRCLRQYFRTVSRNRIFSSCIVLSTERLYELLAEIIHAFQLRSESDAWESDSKSILKQPEPWHMPDNEFLIGLPDWGILIRAIRAAEWREDSHKKVKFLFEQMLREPYTQQMPWIWRLYLLVELARENYLDAKKIALRAINHCGWCKLLYMDIFGPLRPCFADEELNDLSKVMEKQGIFLRG